MVLHLNYSFIHIFPYEKFLIPFIDFINANFPSTQHMFYVWGKLDYLDLDLDVYNNIRHFPSKIKMLSNKDFQINLHSCNKIIVHSFLSNLIAFFLIPYLSKTTFIFWGHDIYELREPSKSLLSRFIRFVKLKIIEYADTIATIIKGDYDLLCKYCNPRGTHSRAIYRNSNTKEMDKLLSKNFLKKPFQILVGNSATSENRHIEIFRMLARYKDESLFVIVPLSYGTKQYRAQVIDAGVKILGDAFKPIIDFMCENDYLEILSQCSIGIFNTNRQQGIGNILAMGYLGAKVYICNETVMWTEFVEECGMLFHDIKEISDQDYRQFAHITNDELETNRKLIGTYLSQESALSIWNNIFTFGNTRVM